jgi:hypothetical protein
MHSWRPLSPRNGAHSCRVSRGPETFVDMCVPKHGQPLQSRDMTEPAVSRTAGRLEGQIEVRQAAGPSTRGTAKDKTGVAVARMGKMR